MKSFPSAYSFFLFNHQLYCGEIRSSVCSCLFMSKKVTSKEKSVLVFPDVRLPNGKLPQEQNLSVRRP